MNRNTPVVLGAYGGARSFRTRECHGRVGVRDGVDPVGLRLRNDTEIDRTAAPFSTRRLRECMTVELNASAGTSGGRTLARCARPRPHRTRHGSGDLHALAVAGKARVTLNKDGSAW